MSLFTDQLSRGQVGEYVAARILSDSGCEVISFNDDKRYDILYKDNKNGYVKRLEVKTDLMSYHTNRTAIEEPLRHTEAHKILYFSFFGQELRCYLLTPKSVFEYITRCINDGRYLKKGRNRPQDVVFANNLFFEDHGFRILLKDEYVTIIEREIERYE